LIGSYVDLLKTLTSGDDEAQDAAVQELSRLGNTIVEPLAELLIGAQDADVRWWAARALAEIGGQAVVGPLVQALADAEPDVRACAALALGHIGPARQPRPWPPAWPTTAPLSPASLPMP